MDDSLARPVPASAVARLWASIPSHAALALSASPHEVLFVDADGALCALDLERRRVAPIAIDPAVRRWLRDNNPTALTISIDGSTRIFEAARGLLVARASSAGAQALLQLDASDESRLRIVGVTPTGTTVIAVAPQGDEPRLRAYDTASGAVLFELPARVGALSRCGRFVAAACEDPSGGAEVTLLEQGRRVARATRPRKPVALTFAADPRFLWGYGDGDLFCLDVTHDRAVAAVLPSERVTALFPRADGAGAWLALYPRLVTRDTPEVCLRAVSPPSEGEAVTPPPPTQGFRVLARPAMSPDGRAVVVPGWAGGPCVVDTATGEVAAKPERVGPSHGYVFSRSPLVVAPCRGLLAAALGRDVYALDARSLAVRWQSVAARDVEGATLSADGDVLFLVDDMGELSAWATEDGTERWRMKIVRDGIEQPFDVSASSCGRWLVVASSDWRSHLIDVGSRKVRRRFRGRATFVDTPSGPRLLSLDRQAGRGIDPRPPRVVVRQLDPGSELRGARTERWSPAGVGFDADIHVLVASPSGRYIVGRTGEDPIDFVIDRESRDTRSFGGSLHAVLGRAQLRDDVFLAVLRPAFGVDPGLRLLPFRPPVGADPRRSDAISVVSVADPVSVTLAPGAVFILDDRGAVARYDLGVGDGDGARA